MADAAKHVMIDLETLGTTAGCVILSIAAVEFTTSGEIGRQYTANISLQSSSDAGFQIDADTLEWWMKQPSETRSRLFVNPRPIVEVLYNFENFMKSVDSSLEKVKVCANGAAFDLGILGYAFKHMNRAVPWKFWNERDLRTLLDLAPYVKDKVVFEGTKHDPLDDCLHQIKLVFAVYNQLAMHRMTAAIYKRLAAMDGSVVSASEASDVASSSGSSSAAAGSVATGDV